MSDTETECRCGYGPGATCDPRCPAYVEPIAKVAGEVSIKGRIQSHKPDNATYTSFTFDSGSTVPFVLLGKDENRCRAVLILSGTTGGVYIGRKNAVMSNGGAFVPYNTLPLELQNTDEVYARGDGSNTVTVSVINERYS